tara:strand:- start:2596 stop:2781 length:186 start_codon:yes stop_codon:yes gene_type:complete
MIPETTTMPQIKSFRIASAPGVPPFVSAVLDDDRHIAQLLNKSQLLRLIVDAALAVESMED